MPSTPARALRSNSSTPVSGNTAGSMSTRGRRRKEQPLIELKDDDDEDDDEQFLQTQLPLQTQHERDDEDNDEDYEDDANAEIVSRSKSQKERASSNVKRSARKTISAQKQNDTLVAEESEAREEEPVEEAAAVTVKPEATKEIDDNRGSEMTTIDPNVAKHRIHQYYYDILDHEQHKILYNHSARITSWPILQHFWSSYPYNEYEYGRLYVRSRLCSLLVDGNSEPGYTKTSLVAWEATDWQDFIDDLRTTKDACLNPNCSHIFDVGKDGSSSMLGPSITDTDRQERLMESQHLANSKSFNQKYSIVEKTCQMNLLLSPIRQTIEAQIVADATGPPTDISEVDVKTLHAAAASCDSVVVRKHLYRLFLPSDDNDPASTSNDEDEDDDFAPPQAILKNIEDLKEVLRTKPLDLLWLQSRIDRLIWLWNEECFGTNQPYLNLIKYHDAERGGLTVKTRTPLNRGHGLSATNRSSDPKTPPARDKEERVDVLETLKRRRNALNKNHGDDPLIESRKLAATTKPKAKATTEVVPAKNILYEGKKSNIAVHFDDSEDEDEIKDDDDDDEEEEGENGDNYNEGRVRLPKLPKKRRIMKSPSATQEGTSSGASRIYTGPPPDDGIFDDNGNVKHRNPWEEEEMVALLSGLEKYGLGKWVYIKQEYGYILRNRTTVQLKDKFRNMKKNGELPDRYMAVQK